MTFGKIYSYPNNPRTTALFVVAKACGLDIELVNEEPGKCSEAYLKLNPLGKVPTFQGNDKFVLSETIAIAVYLASQNEKSTLLGNTKQEYALILKWMSYTNSEVISPLAGWFRALIGRDPYNKKNVQTSQAAALKAVAVMENHLLSQTFLVGERLSLADIFATSILSRGYQYVFDKEFRGQYPNLTRWYDLIRNQEVYKSVAGDVTFIDEAVKYTPKKEPKKEVKKEPTEENDEEEAAPAAPKPNHPLEALGRPTFLLDDWKRKYSNTDTRTDALPWFWENYKPDEYSLWKVDYKYNEELTQIFMSSNLIGGFFNRLEASRKFIFGSLCVYGESNKSIITGAFLIRGQEHEPAFDVAPDWESYQFTKLDPSKESDKALLGCAWSWDNPLVVDGETYRFADGKVFK